jgi:hypothetical protein
MESSAYRKTAIDCAKEAGDIIKAAWDKPRNVINKGDFDLVCTVVKRIIRHPHQGVTRLEQLRSACE